MTILELITKLDRDTHIIVRYNYGDEILDDEILDFWSSDYFCEILIPQDRKIVECTDVESFHFEDGILTIYVECIQGI